MTDLVGKQRTIGQRISRIVSNLKKKGKANITMGTLQSSLSILKELWADFREGDLAVREAAETDPKIRESSYLREDEYEEVQQVFIDQSGTLRDMIEELKTEVTVKESSTSNPTVAETVTQRSRAVLPKIALPTFDGQYKDWPGFRDLFTSLIVKDSSLSAVERLHYLKSCLKGNAAALIKNVKTTADNFDVAWKKLEDRFQNTRLLVQAQIRLLANLAPVRKESSVELQRLFNETFDAVGALENLERPVTNASDWVVELTVERLDRQSRRDWEDSIKLTKTVPTLEELKSFLTGRIQACEALEPPPQEGSAHSGASTNRVRSNAAGPPKGFKVHQVSNAASSGLACSMCKEQHYIQRCPQFRAKSIAERRDAIRVLALCYNCLGSHHVKDCQSDKRCQKCEGRHHTLIHEGSSSSKEPCSAGSCVQHVSADVSNFSAILGTARVAVLGPLGQRSLARVLIDPGSEVSLISEALTQRLGLRRSQARVPLRGVGRGRTQYTRGRTLLTLTSHQEQGEPIQVPAYVLSELSSYQPRELPSPSSWPHLGGLSLADPTYHHSDPVDILLGADSYDLIIREGVKKGPPHTPVAQETCFGWILTGGTCSSNGEGAARRSEVPVLHCSVDRELMATLNKFWEQEEIEVTVPGTEDDRRAEDHFSSTHCRQPDGRFMVRLPFKVPPELGTSRNTAVRTLNGLSHKFQHSPEFRLAYSDFLETYETMGHMSPTNQSPSVDSYYLPHHGVFRESSTTTKLRVVFNGSMPTTNGKSLNDFLLRGPNLLPNLADVLMRWRRYRFVFSADIEKMYRQILVHPEDRRWQRIVWRPNQERTIIDYDLNTVTYGLACAPYLAIRCLHQLAQREDQRYQRGSQVVLRDIYMDDVLTGADSIQEARLIQTEVRELLMAGGFPLRKWASNSRELLEGLSIDERKGIKEWDSPTTHSVLGIQWLPYSDCFQVSAVNLQTVVYTKRAVLSGTAQLFDPLGWLAPVIIVAKVLLQSLWLLKVDWDTPLPEKEEIIWRKFLQQLPALRTVSVPRWLGICSSNSALEIHGFADASERAYAAVVYSRTYTKEGVATVSLIVAKSKVAPLKRVSLPRLELCAAFLLTKLVSHVVKVLESTDVDLHLWSDSSVTLSWIQGHPSRWPTYVANRVAEIQRLLPLAQWHHVRSAENPADCASRGLYPAEMPDFELWWRGPAWLTSSRELPVVNTPETIEVTEPTVHHMVSPKESSSCAVVKRFSSLTRLFRVVAWCLRWRIRNRNQEATLTTTEIHNSRITLLRLEQTAHFSDDITALRKNQPVASKSRLAKLSPFLDTDGVLRVGGRLQVANIAYDRKHPAILPDDSHLAQLWVDAAHKRCLHGGTQLTLATLRQECWVLKGRQMVKSCIRLCTTCIRWRGQTAQPKMGNLPVARITPCRSFLRSGIDYAGPIQIRASRGRGQRTLRGYIAVFICLATKAVHLEAVSDGSTETFLAALRRFMARRGRCLELYSDCGRNFVGANNELQALLRDSVKQGGGPSSAASIEGISWRFNPPSAPHFGGIWEAAVKSVKHHLRRVIGEQPLTFEELTTLLTGIEACLNSRPLLPLSDDPEDPVALTPGHFLIGEPLLSIPEPSLVDLPVSRLSRWQLIQQMYQHFWNRWSREYLNSLQPRGKWHKDKTLIKSGVLCLIKNELLPPTQWPLARVVQVHPGPDDSVRVATVRTASSQYRRPVHKLIPLLFPDAPDKDSVEIHEASLAINPA